MPSNQNESNVFIKIRKLGKHLSGKNYKLSTMQFVELF